MQRPQSRELFHLRVALHFLEARQGIFLLACGKLGNTEEQARLGRILHAGLRDTALKAFDRLVVLLITVVREADAHVSSALRVRRSVLRNLVETGLVGLGLVLRGREELLALVRGGG